jgi:pimeloyl-ACP methyl ester carboxylesterase
VLRISKAGTARGIGWRAYRRQFATVACEACILPDRIKTPLLLIHGERDNNPGTVPLQSEKLFEAIRGAGGTARLVMLPMEPHVYLTRESVEQTLYETLAWFDRYVKNAPPRAKPASADRVN